MVAAAGVRRGFRSIHRLRKTDEFSSVFAFRHVLRGAIFELLHCPGHGDSARLGVVVPKRFVPQAVARNLVKRIVRESFRLSRSALPAHDIIIRVMTRTGFPDRKVLRREIDQLFARLAR